MGNISDGKLDLSDLKYVDLDEREERRFLLELGDVLINRTNTKELVGKAAVFETRGRWLFASYLLRLRVDTSQVLPGFLVAWLNSPDARAQIDKVSRQAAGMTNINSNDIRALQMPLPSLGVQEELLADYARARDEAEKSRSEALLAIEQAAEHVERQVGIAAHERQGRLVYAISPAAIRASRSRLDVLSYHPARVSARSQVALRHHSQLGDLVRSVVDRHEGESTTCLSLSDVETNSGLLARSTPRSAPQEIGGALSYARGDILYGRLRPALNKVWLADAAGCCSPEFRVLRAAPGAVEPAFLAAVMRSSIILDQTQYAATGNTHPRIADSDLMEILIPMVDLPTQRLISKNVIEAQQTYARLQLRSESIRHAAKDEFDRLALRDAL